MSADKNNIAQQAAKGSLYTVLAALITIVLGFARTTLMLRLLLPEHFGVTTLALFYVNLAMTLFAFGFDSAFIHHKDTNETTRRTYFTLRLGFGVTGLLLLALLTPVISSFYPEMPLLTAVLLAYILIYIFRTYNMAQTAILNKQLAFRQIAQADVISAINMTIFGLGAAWLGWGVWAIVVELFSGVFTRLLVIQIFYRPWRPRLGWRREQVKWFWEYGKKAWHSSNLTFFLDRFDDWFTGTVLGSNALGYYSRAYEYAGYPQRVFANPILTVFFPTFARVQGERQKLSRAFFRPTSLMVRSGGWFCLIFILTAPEFIPLLLGEQWLPMLATFQLMIVYTLLEPLSMAAHHLLMATGHPQQVLRARLVQIVTFIPAVMVLGWQWNIEGVALATNLMALAGTVL
ncbi:MAG TPA: oligosaccharide flippase family protein, partial [Chloroflexota bacterium]|nr:oligosaccharide flippase family protein [Chloroflexota bacterium]